MEASTYLMRILPLKNKGCCTIRRFTFARSILSSCSYCTSIPPMNDQISSTRQLTKRPVFSTKPKSKSEREAQAFVDFRHVSCIAGDGGDGVISFLRQKNVPFGGPDGGNGGNGGHIIFKADKKATDLSKVNEFISGYHGKPGGSDCCHGLCGDHTFVPVPLNTLIKYPVDHHRSTEEGIIHELVRDGDVFIAARGGAGGHGNNFYLSNFIRKPIKAEYGGKGEKIAYELEMRVMATAGLVGFPNAGKSTFLRAISRAKPKVASYPFTTVNPHIGMVQYDDFQQVAVADIPGLIEGAHKNVGLGFNFLKHITRCTCIFYVLDYTLKDFVEQFDSLKKELHLYNPCLSTKIDAIIVNKMDLIKEEKEMDDIRAMFPSRRLFFVSGRERMGLEPVLIFLREKYDINCTHIEEVYRDQLSKSFI